MQCRLKYNNFDLNPILEYMLNIRKLASIAIQLNLQACRIIKESYEQKDLPKYIKSNDSPVTQADFKIQTLLIKGIKQYFPKLLIIGEQSEEYKGKLDFDFNKLQSEILKNTIQLGDNIANDQCCLWIDPLDSTNGFLYGNLQDVTTLVGLTYKNRPILGFIATAYRSQFAHYVYDPRVYFGSTIVSKAYVYTKASSKFQVLKCPSPKQRLKLASSSYSNYTHIHNNLVMKFGVENIQAGGIGHKILMVARGQVDMMICRDPYTHKWDCAAGQAIISSVGGKLCSAKGQDIIYEPEYSTYNKQGLLCTNSKEMAQKIVTSGILQ